ncbi:6-O-methylguanine DNA methyltransferase [Crepidotus variabilis]|uniref:Methylated-DNA--protein-cysteine methyltransferase n=1 Tax=Crepidotus variabilis TaxID=179855 RepID=A0A9P6ELD5_9AGAR|nr:6-O-methylguanine DNA methyltransferase [Crepidotus variabilis]
MPAYRTRVSSETPSTDLAEASKPSRFFEASKTPKSRSKTVPGTGMASEASSEDIQVETVLKKALFPTTDSARKEFKNHAGKHLTLHQWAVYDFTLTIPSGKVTTYKDVAQMIGGSPRSVGNALRNNPFPPYVPCHRVIASDHFVGGFYGEWGKDHKTGTRYNQKVNLLANEGVSFSEKGYLLDVSESIWRRTT